MFLVSDGGGREAPRGAAVFFFSPFDFAGATTGLPGAGGGAFDKLAGTQRGWRPGLYSRSLNTCTIFNFQSGTALTRDVSSHAFFGA